ncbi:MAG: hypothetical protein AB7H77_07640 [Bdellovibrionales bacterium]
MKKLRPDILGVTPVIEYHLSTQDLMGRLKNGLVAHPGKPLVCRPTGRTQRPGQADPRQKNTKQELPCLIRHVEFEMEIDMLKLRELGMHLGLPI